MTHLAKIPEPIYQGIEALNKLVEENPLFIPLPQLASFLGCKADGLRNSIDKGQCPFAIGWQLNVRGNKAYKIPTVPFYLWYTQSSCFREVTQ